MLATPHRRYLLALIGTCALQLLCGSPIEIYAQQIVPSNPAISTDFPQNGTSPAGEQSLPPLQRMLTGEDEERVAKRAEQIAELRTEGRYAEAISLANEILSIRHQAQGVDHWQIADARRLVDTLNQIILKSPDEQEEVTQADVIEGRVKAVLYDPKSKLQVINLLDWEIAEALRKDLEVQLEIRRRLLGNDHQETFRTVHTLGELLEDQGRSDEAIQLVNEALAGRRRVLGDDHPETLLSLNESNFLAIYQHSQHQDDVPYLEAIERSRRVLGNDHAITLFALYFLGSRRSEQGREEEAESLSLEVLDGRRRLLGDDHWQTVAAMNQLAKSYYRSRDLAKSEVYVLEALSRARSALGDEHPETLRSLKSLGLLRASQGRLEEAGQLAREAAEGLRRLLGPNNPYMCYNFLDLGNVLNAQGKYTEAESILLDTLDSYRRLCGDEYTMVYWTGYRLADLYFEWGRLEESEAMFRWSVEGLRRNLGDDNMWALETIVDLADLLLAMGKLDDAEVLLREALNRQRRVLGNTHWRVVWSIDSLALLEAGKGNLAAAEAAWTEAAAGYELMRMRAWFSGLERAASLASYSPLESLAICLAMNGKSVDAWQRYEANLARGLLDMVSSRLSRQLSEEELGCEAELIGKLSTLDERIGALVGGKEQTGETETMVKRLLQEQEAVQAELAQFKAEMAARHGVEIGEVYSLQRIQERLDEYTAILGWVDVDDFFIPDWFREHWACVVRKDGDPVWVKLLGSGGNGDWSEEDDELTLQCQRELSRWATGPAIRRRQELVRQLYEQRIGPLEQYLSGVRHLVVLPTGRMAGVPVEAITDQYTVSYVPSGTMYARFKEIAERKGSNMREAPGLLLALGDPVFLERTETGPLTEPPEHGVMIAMVMPGSNALRSGLEEGDVLLSYGEGRLEGPDDLDPAIRQAQEAVTAEGEQEIPVSVWRDGKTVEMTVAPGRLEVRTASRSAPEAILAKRRMDAVLTQARGPSCDPIPYTRLEVETIARLFTQDEKESQPTILLGSEASEQRLNRLAVTGELEKYSFLHLATHCQMNNRVAMESALLLSQDRLSDAFERVLRNEEVYDGRLTAGQIARTWQLDADLVVLSGCATALGKEAGGEGYLGFSQALFAAGARSLLLSLWKVDDLATQVLMERFYENMLGRFDETRSVPGSEFAPGEPLPKAVALREAKVWLRDLTRDDLIDVMAEFPDSGFRGPEPHHDLPDTPLMSRPFQDPHFWAAFILIGDPD